MTAARRWVPPALALLAVAWPLLLALGRWPRWWEWIASEQTPMTWLQSVVLVVAGCFAALVALVVRHAGGTGSTRRERWSWWVFAAGFAALALDERFAVHERVRDGVLAPRGVRVPFLPWVAPGDFLILAVALCGLAMLPLVRSAVRDDRAASTALLVAVGLGLVAVAADSVDPSTWTVHGERLEQTLEEVVELACGLALLACVLLRLLGLLRPLGPLDAAAPAPRDAGLSASAGSRP